MTDLLDQRDAAIGPERASERVAADTVVQAAGDRFRTHQVANQVPPLDGYDPLACDPAVADALSREGARDALPRIREVAQVLGSAEGREHARLANEHKPQLRTHDRYGNRIDEVEYHQSYHRLMQVAVAEGGGAAAWTDGRAGAHVARAARSHVWGHTEAGHGCPISMTYAVVPALQANDALHAHWLPRLASRVYDPSTPTVLASLWVKNTASKAFLVRSPISSVFYVTNCDSSEVVRCSRGCVRLRGRP